MGAVPFQEAKWFRSGNRVMSPTSTRGRAAADGPIPFSPDKVVPVLVKELRWARSERNFGGSRRALTPPVSGIDLPAALVEVEWRSWVS